MCVGSRRQSNSQYQNPKGQVALAAVVWARSPDHSSPYGGYLSLAQFGNCSFGFVKITGGNSCCYSVSFLSNISLFLPLSFLLSAASHAHYSFQKRPL